MKNKIIYGTYDTWSSDVSVEDYPNEGDYIFLECGVDFEIDDHLDWGKVLKDVKIGDEIVNVKIMKVEDCCPLEPGDYMMDGEYWHG